MGGGDAGTGDAGGCDAGGIEAEVGGEAGRTGKAGKDVRSGAHGKR
jgi:hypothetical protein